MSWKVQKMKGHFTWAAVCFLMLYPAIKERAYVQDGRGFQELLSYDHVCSELTPGLLGHPEDQHLARKKCSQSSVLPCLSFFELRDMTGESGAAPKETRV